MTEVAGDPWPPQIPQSATTTTNAIPLIGYEARPPQLEPNGWLTVQLLELRHPPCCSCCLAPTQSLRAYACGPLAKVPIPVCEKCNRFYKGERAWILFVAGAVGAAAGIGSAMALSLPAEGGAVLTLIASAAALVVGAYIASIRTVPARFSRFSATQNTVRIRFRNPAYAHARLEAGRVV